MKDQILLLLSGLAAAVGAWFFFQLAGAHALELIGLVSVVALAADNVRLRRELRRLASHAN